VCSSIKIISWLQKMVNVPKVCVDIEIVEVLNLVPELCTDFA
jgi:hypothetical protein